MEVEERLYGQLEDALYASLNTPADLLTVRKLLVHLARAVDLKYPAIPPPERIGHEFARDALSILDNIESVSEPSLLQDLEASSLDSPSPTSADEWELHFPRGTELDLSPFEVERLIQTRRRQVRELDDKITLLTRRIDRLRSLRVRMRPAEE
ncbi:hypothetical protein GMRT_16149 [Giardia muris]|uniref:Uncharacterized protein n=1 Tax=Giardia muris TaxID=5742 RepID=A0A4Z1SYH7_GIAMU|nr:hypothetical protein GMRT_16149 [Giardia muris]|eukprot:TNJ30744.1 hypothetical protein GMRT_16149 [Giardia muris]